QIRHTPSVPRSTLTCPLWPWDTATRRVPLGNRRKLPGESAGSARWGPPFSVSSPTSPARARDRTRAPPVLSRHAHTAAEILDTAIAKKCPGSDDPGHSAGSGDRIRTCDLWVMSPASYRTAPPRVVV